MNRNMKHRVPESTVCMGTSTALFFAAPQVVRQPHSQLRDATAVFTFTVRKEPKLEASLTSSDQFSKWIVKSRIQEMVLNAQLDFHRY